MASNEAIWAATAQMIPHHSKAGFLQIENYESDTRFQDTDNVARLNMILDLVARTPRPDRSQAAIWVKYKGTTKPLIPISFVTNSQ